MHTPVNLNPYQDTEQNTTQISLCSPVVNPCTSPPILKALFCSNASDQRFLLPLLPFCINGTPEYTVFRIKLLSL